jgi:hypothetical protein
LSSRTLDSKTDSTESVIPTCGPLAGTANGMLT